MIDDPKRQADRIIEALEKKGLTSHWSKLDVENARHTILHLMQRTTDQPTFEELALVMTDPPSDGWPANYQERFWDAYPRRANKGTALKILDRIRKIGNVPFDVIFAAVEVYRHETRNTEMRYIALPATWLNGRRWEDEREAIGGPPILGRGEVKNGFMSRLME